ncbi:putative membrane protein, partial [Dysosmobacter welbionis]
MTVVGTPAKVSRSRTRRAMARFRPLSTVPSAATAPPSSPPWPASTTTTGDAPSSPGANAAVKAAFPCHSTAESPATKQHSSTTYATWRFRIRIITGGTPWGKPIPACLSHIPDYSGSDGGNQGQAPPGPSPHRMAWAHGSHAHPTPEGGIHADGETQ